MKSGNGVLTYINGDKYDGEWKNNMMHGQGVFEHNKGDIYNGTWKNNKKSGYGVYTYSNGDVYEGMFIEDTLEGYGTLTYFNGTFLASLLSDKLESIKIFLVRIKHLLKIAQPILSQTDIGWVHKSKEQLLLTETQTKQLKDKARFYRLRNGSHSLPIIKYDKPSSKLERKRLFKDICEVLTK